MKKRLKMKNNSIHIILTLICMFGTQVFGQSIRNVHVVSQTKMNLEIKPTAILKKHVSNNSTPQAHTYYYQTAKSQSVDNNAQMKIKLREPKESLPLKNASAINVKEIKLVKSPTLNTQMNPSIKDKKNGAPIKKPTTERQRYPASRKINEK